MKACTIKVLALVAAVTCSTLADTFAQSAFHISLQDDNGLTRVSVSWSGDITNTGIPAPDDYWIGVGSSYRNAVRRRSGRKKTADALRASVRSACAFKAVGASK